MSHTLEAKGATPLALIETRVGRPAVLHALRVEGPATAAQIHRGHFRWAGSIEDVGRQISDLVALRLAFVVREKSRFPARHRARIYCAAPAKALQ